MKVKEIIEAKRKEDERKKLINADTTKMTKAEQEEWSAKVAKLLAESEKQKAIDKRKWT